MDVSRIPAIVKMYEREALSEKEAIWALQEQCGVSESTARELILGVE